MCDLDYIAALTPKGYTAGHQGLAWGWYLLSESWAPHFPASAAPAAMSDASTVKAIILMTDGNFGTLVKTGTDNAATVASKLCDEIKRTTRVRIYAVAFNAGPSAASLMRACASDPSFVYEAANAAELTEAYKSIARTLTDLRIKS